MTHRAARRVGALHRNTTEYREDLALRLTHLTTRLTMALVAMLLAVGWAGVATAGAQTQQDTDFSGGTPDANTEVVPPGDLTLRPAHRRLD